MSAGSEETPGAELAAEIGALAHGLRRAVARRARHGRRERHAPRPAAALPAPAAQPTPAAQLSRTATSQVEPAASAKAPAATAPAASDPAALLRQRAASCGTLEELRAAVAECTACELCKTRTQTVFSDGTGSSGVVFVGEAPGQHEDQQGVPFVGRAGELLTGIVTKGMGLAREDVMIVNVLKCRPPENRDPTAAEKALCTGWLDRQLELIQERATQAPLLIALGRHAAMHLLGSEGSMASMRGQVRERRTPSGRTFRVVATYHPAYLLRSPHMKKDCWQDIQLAMRELGLPIPARGR